MDSRILREDGKAATISLESSKAAGASLLTIAGRTQAELSSGQKSNLENCRLSPASV